MERKYRTSHQGIAALLVMQGYDILRAEQGTDRNGRSRIYLEFDTDAYTGKQAGDELINDQARGSFKRFYDAQYTVRQKVREVLR